MLETAHKHIPTHQLPVAALFMAMVLHLRNRDGEAAINVLERFTRAVRHGTDGNIDGTMEAIGRVAIAYDMGRFEEALGTIEAEKCMLKFITG